MGGRKRDDKFECSSLVSSVAGEEGEMRCCRDLGVGSGRSNSGLSSVRVFSHQEAGGSEFEVGSCWSVVRWRAFVHGGLTDTFISPNSLIGSPPSLSTDQKSFIKSGHSSPQCLSPVVPSIKTQS